MRRKIRALLLDVDGTMADTEFIGHLPAFNQAFRYYGIDLQWDIDTYIELYHYSSGLERIRVGLRMAFGSEPSTTLVSGLHFIKTSFYQESLRKGLIQLRPGVARLIKEARTRGVMLGVVTTSTAKSARILIQTQLGEDALNWFDVIIGMENEYPLKPAPDMYVAALKMLGVNSDEVLVIEDSANGARAATAANIKTVVTINELTKMDEFEGVIAIVESLGEPGCPSRVLLPPNLQCCGAVVTLNWLKHIAAMDLLE